MPGFIQIVIKDNLFYEIGVIVLYLNVFLIFDPVPRAILVAV